jgi:hypothetical protein
MAVIHGTFVVVVGFGVDDPAVPVDDAEEDDHSLGLL